MVHQSEPRGNRPRGNYAADDGPGDDAIRTTNHVCDPLVCGISYDAKCPAWRCSEPEYGSPEWHRSCTRQQFRGYRRDVRLADRIRSLPPLARVALIDLIRDILAEDLPAAVAHLLHAKGRRK